jgi:hypothetical protein
MPLFSTFPDELQDPLLDRIWKMKCVKAALEMVGQQSKYFFIPE